MQMQNFNGEDVFSYMIKNKRKIKNDFPYRKYRILRFRKENLHLNKNFVII